MSDRKPFRPAPEQAGELSTRTAFSVYPSSVLTDGTLTVALGARSKRKALLLSVPPGQEALLDAFEATPAAGKGNTRVGPLSGTNAACLRQALPALAPRLGGRRASVGCGDRLGVATPGHVRALGDSGLFPFLAQQSMREMARTGRSPAAVMDDALWGVLQAGYTAGFGADADHLKQPDDIDVCARAGFTMFTVDPGDHVDDAADASDRATLEKKLAALEQAGHRFDRAALEKEYLARPLELDGENRLVFTPETLLRALVKYGGAITHTIAMFRHLKKVMGDRPCELEMSVDETESPTTPEEHYFVASRLRAAGVEWVSLAPRFPGRFEKGVDYIGDIPVLEKTLRAHRAIARALGDYKLSIHSGSDKFSIYPAIARLTGGRVHLKTAGTSYLEALRTIAAADSSLFREIYRFARERYETDRASYHVSADMARVTPEAALSPADLPGTLEQFDTRQMFHVTFGSVLTTTDAGGGYLFRDRFFAALRAHEEAHYQNLAGHLGRHITPFK